MVSLLPLHNALQKATMTLAFEPTAAFGDNTTQGSLHGARRGGATDLFKELSQWIARCLGASRPSQAHAAVRGYLDGSTGLYNQAGLLDYGAAMLRAARTERRPLAMVILDFSDLPEVQGIYGNRISRKVLARVTGKLVAAAGRKGLAARTGKAQFALLLPGIGREKAQLAIQKAMGTPCRIEFDAGDSEIVLVPEVLADCISPDCDSVAQLYRGLCQSLAAIRSEEDRRQHYLQRERERHSRPMGLRAIADAPAPRPMPQRLPDTVPMPLALKR